MNVKKEGLEIHRLIESMNVSQAEIHMNNGFIVRECREEDIDEINKLFKKYSGIDRTREQWKWEYENGPYGKGIYVIAEYRGRIVGTQALIPIMLVHNGQEVLSAKAEEAYLYLGDFKKLYGKCVELAIDRGIQVIWGFTKARAIFKNVGFSINSKIKYSFVIINPNKSYLMLSNKITTKNSLHSAILRFSLKVVLHLLCFRTKIMQFIASRQKIKPDYKVESIDFTDKRLDIFWDTFTKNNSFMTVVRKRDFLSWRLLNNPYVESKVIAITQEDTIKCYAVINYNKEKGIASIADICFLNGVQNKVIKKLLSISINELISKKAAYIITIHNCSHISQIEKKHLRYLRKAGFVDLPGSSDFVIQSLTNNSQFTKLKSWFITHLFTEGREI